MVYQRFSHVEGCLIQKEAPGWFLFFFCFSFSKISSRLFKKGSSAGVPASWNVEIGVFPKWNRNSLNSANLINHWSMNWAQFKNHVSHMCLTGTVAGAAGSSPFTVMINILPLNSANSVKTFWKNSIVLILIGATSRPRLSWQDVYLRDINTWVCVFFVLHADINF